MNNATCAPSELAAKTGDESRAEFANGQAVFFQNGTWEYANRPTLPPWASPWIRQSWP